MNAIPSTLFVSDFVTPVTVSGRRASNRKSFFDRQNVRQASADGIIQLRTLISLLLTSAIVNGQQPASVAVVSKADQPDYCYSETFAAECQADDEVLYVRSATYGRMRGNSRCLQSDPNLYVGCKVSVVQQADRMCSGRRSCRIPIPNQSFDAVQQCPVGVRSYLEIIVECLRVTTVPPGHQCGPDWPLVVRASPTEPRWLSSYVAVQRGFGTPTCPWRIETEPGRRINITLIDFATPTASELQPGSTGGGSSSAVATSGGLPSVCYQYASIDEKPGLVGNKMVVSKLTVCGGNRREKNLTLTASHVVDIQFSRRNVETEREFYFLLKYRAVGCAEPQSAPRHGFLSRNRGDSLTLTVGCNATGSSYLLICDETTGNWIGDFDFATSSCPKATLRAERVTMTWTSFHIPIHVKIGVLVGLAAVAFIVILLFFMICTEGIKASRAEASRNKSHKLLNQQQQQVEATAAGGRNGGNQSQNSAASTSTAVGGQQQQQPSTNKNKSNSSSMANCNSKTSAADRRGVSATAASMSSSGDKNHVLVDLDATLISSSGDGDSPSDDSPLPSPPPLPPSALSGNGDENDNGNDATGAPNDDDMSTYVRAVWPMAPPIGAGRTAGPMMTSSPFPLPPPPLSTPPLGTGDAGSSMTANRKRRTLSSCTAAAAAAAVGAVRPVSIQPNVTAGQRPVSAFVGVSQAQTSAAVSLAPTTTEFMSMTTARPTAQPTVPVAASTINNVIGSGNAATRTWNPRHSATASNVTSALSNRPYPSSTTAVAPPPAVSSVCSSAITATSSSENVWVPVSSGQKQEDFRYDDYDSTHIRETPKYVRREQQVAAAAAAAAAASSASSTAAAAMQRGGGQRRSLGPLPKKPGVPLPGAGQQNRYFEVIPNGCDSTDCDNESDDDDFEDDDDGGGSRTMGGGRGRYDAIAAAARCRSKSLPRNAAVLTTSSTGAVCAINRYH